jgi:hypothetical protein
MKLGISAFIIAMLAITNSHAAKVCVADNAIYNLYHKYKNWYCSNSSSIAPSVNNPNDHGADGPIHCWCFENGSWWYAGGYNFNDLRCRVSCSGDCGI